MCPPSFPSQRQPLRMFGAIMKIRGVSTLSISVFVKRSRTVKLLEEIISAFSPQTETPPHKGEWTRGDSKPHLLLLKNGLPSFSQLGSVRLSAVS